MLTPGARVVVGAGRCGDWGVGFTTTGCREGWVEGLAYCALTSPVVFHRDGRILQVLDNVLWKALHHVRARRKLGVQKRRGRVLGFVLGQQRVVAADDDAQRLHSQARAVHLAERTRRGTGVRASNGYRTVKMNWVLEQLGTL
eukprot:361568-Chlamydomonas_euryale.AAC.3